MTIRKCKHCSNTFIKKSSPNHVYCGKCVVITCEMCGNHENIELHHLKERRIGGTETMPLCSSCHKIVTLYHWKLNSRMFEVREMRIKVVRRT